MCKVLRKGAVDQAMQQSVAKNLADINASTLHLLKDSPHLFDAVAERALKTLIGSVTAARGRTHAEILLGSLIDG